MADFLWTPGNVRNTVICVVAVAAIGIQCASLASGQTPGDQPTESGFDFVLGEWNVRGAKDAPVIAHNSFTRTPDSTAIVEQYRQGLAFAGIGLHYFDRATKQWRQTWTANNGGNGELQGRLDGDTMRYEGIIRNPAGIANLVRGSFQSVDADHLIQKGEMSPDEGKTWKPTYVFYYDRTPPGARPADALSPVAQVLAVDRVLSRQRDALSQQMSADAAVSAYIAGLDAIDFSKCPKAFTEAMNKHRAAWEHSIPFLKQHSGLRGEMHELLRRVQASSPEAKREWDGHFQAIMEAWALVEASNAPASRTNSEEGRSAQIGEELYEYVTATRLEQTDLQQLLKCRRSVWEAWFAGDEQKLRDSASGETVTGDSSRKDWLLIDQVVEESKQFSASGAKLEELVFEKNLVQVFGDSVILYVNFHGKTSNGSTVSPMSGSAVEVFVRRGDRWTNPGWYLSFDAAE